jgi:subtilisin family serine protease
MSLGGYPAPYLEAVLAYAAEQNIIPIAAAGNIWPFIVYPAKYNEVIAVGASNIDNKVWSGSAKGSAVDFCAPGEQVYCADWDNSSPNRKPIVNNGSGTSFSTAFTAATAALWLEKFDRNQLLSSLHNDQRLVDVFRAHVKKTVNTPSSWDRNVNGAGILNVEALLNDNFPKTNNIVARTEWQRWQETSAQEILYNLFENSDPVIIRQRLKLFFADMDVDEVMADFGQEVIKLLMETSQAIEQIQSAIDAAQTDVEEHIDNAIDTLTDFASVPLGSVAQWFD